MGVPARVGGVDLSSHQSSIIRNGVVPARVGGVDLSWSVTYTSRVWAGWI